MARGRWASGHACLVYRRTFWRRSNCPRGPAFYGYRRVMGLLFPERGRRKSEALPSAPPGIRSICPASEAAEPRGAREAVCHGRLPSGSGRQEVALLRIQRGSMPEKGGIRPQCLCRQRGCAWEVATAWQSSFSQLRLSENRRKQFSLSTMPHVACSVVVNAFQQYERLVNLATAKFGRRCPIFELAHPPPREKARIHWGYLMAAC